MLTQALGHQPYITWHLAWEPAPPTCSLGKGWPRLGGGGQDHVYVCVCVCLPISWADTGCLAPPTQQPPTPPQEGWDGHWPVLQARTPRVGDAGGAEA